MKNIRLSAPDWCFFKLGMNPAEYYRKLKEFGYEGVEMVAPEHQEIAMQTGLKIVNAAGPGMVEGMNKVTNQEKIITEILGLVENAVKYQIPYIIVFSGNADGMSYEEGLDNCCRGFDALLDGLRGSGVQLLFEMLNKDDHPDYQASDEQFGFELVRRLNNPDFKILYDIYHMYKSGCRPLVNLRNKLPYIGHFHVAALEGRRCPGVGQAIDYRKFFTVVDDVEYQGFVGMEFLTDKPYEELAIAEAVVKSPEST